MRRDLRLVKFSDVGKVITIFPSDECSCEGEAKIFSFASDNLVSRFNVSVDNVPFAKAVCVAEDGISACVQIFFNENDSMKLVEVITAMRDYCWTRECEFSLVYTKDDLWFSEFLLRFVNHEVYYDEERDIYFFTIFK